MTQLAEIDLIVSDVEGCIVPAGPGSWDHEALAAIAARNAAAGRQAAAPLTLCSGRPAQFVEAVGRAIGVSLPVICENGAVMFDPRDSATTLLVEPDSAERMSVIAAKLRELLERPGWARVPFGKEVCVTVVPTSDRWCGDVKRLLYEVVDVLESLNIDPQALEATYSTKAVDLTPAGVSKGTGVAALLGRLGVDPERVLAIGDGGNDLPMLELCGHTAAPRNARDEVAGAVRYIAREREARGVLEILSHFIDGRREQCRR